VVAADDGAQRAVAVNLTTGEAAVIGAQIPADLRKVDLSADGEHALFVGSTAAVVVHLATGEVTALEGIKDHPVGLSPDGAYVFTIGPSPESVPAGDPPVWQLAKIDSTTGASTLIPYTTQRSRVKADLWAAPDNQTVFVRYEGSYQDMRTSRVDVASGKVTYTEPFTPISIENMRWASDGSSMLTELSSSVRVLKPTDQIGIVQKTLTKVGAPLGFAGPDRLVWGHEIPDGADLWLTDVNGLTIGQPTRILTTGKVLNFATAL
jgi:hypothetical protein